MVLEDICNASVYDKNAFYLLGLSVDTTSRTIRRRQEDLIDGLSEMGEKAWNSEFERYLLGGMKAPNVPDAKNLFDQLKDPEFYASEMFFWFWPQGERDDEAIEAIIRGERDSAVRAWVADMGKSGSRGLIARHNIAVALHYYAIDGEKNLLSMAECNGVGGNKRTGSKESLGENVVGAVDRYWKSAFEMWECLSDDDEFWGVFADKVKRQNDPRLDEEFIALFREKFPICFDGINADFMVAYAKMNDIVSAKRHFGYMVSTMSGDDDVEETMERAFKPMTEKIKVLIKQCAATTNPKQVLKACKDLLEGSRDFVKMLKALVPGGNSYTRTIINDIVSAVDNKLPAYSRETGDYEPWLTMTKQLLEMAATPMMREKIRKSVDEWADLVKQERERYTCVVCGHYGGKNIPRKTVKFHCDVRRDPLIHGRFEFRTRTIEVPVCPVCSGTFNDSHSISYGPVKQSLVEGWKFGEKPKQSEIDDLF
jgi:hypothetical protein